MAGRRSARKARLTALALVAVAGGMVGLSFAAVPFYRWFCQVTGFGGTPRTDAVAAPTRVEDRVVTVYFDANVNAGLPWRFGPERLRMQVRLGETALAFYTARNESGGPTAGTATFNVTPDKVGRYVAKLDCFCFTEQRLAAGEEAKMPVSFFVDPDIAKDPETRDVAHITLSYTFFPARTAAVRPTPGGPRPGG
jgi:cytochrome c oxidase assembly protein subunit 11